MKTINLDDIRHKRLKSCAALHGKKMIELVNEGTDAILEKYEDANITIVKKDGMIIREYYK